MELFQIRVHNLKVIKVVLNDLLMQIIRRFKGAEPGSAARAQFDLDCVDPLGRSALSIAIINENPEMMEVLLENRIKVRDT